MIALVSFGVWYTKNNPSKQWKKGAISKYVFNVECLKSKRKPNVSNPVCKSREGFLERILVSLTSKKNAPQNVNKLFTVSNQVSNKEKLQIVKSNLVSTTNPDVINCSNNIHYRNSLNDPKVEFRPKPAPQVEVSSDLNSKEMKSKRLSPLKTDLGSKLAEHIQQFQKGSNKNFKGLKVETQLKFEQLNESPSSTSNTPNSSDNLLRNKSSSIVPAPFYNKKPPPPPI